MFIPLSGEQRALGDAGPAMADPRAAVPVGCTNFYPSARQFLTEG